MFGSLLLVEDEPLIALACLDALEERGFLVSLCGTGFDALNYIEMEPKIAGVITDIRLGDGPDGWEVARRARAFFPTMPVVYITGDSAADFFVERVPDSVILQKPFAHGVLADVVSALLN
jgi:DNA-binding NtrC family response regulator